MKNIDIDDELYQYMVANTQAIGESASSILRRLLNLPAEGAILNDETSSKVIESVKPTKAHSTTVSQSTPVATEVKKLTQSDVKTKRASNNNNNSLSDLLLTEHSQQELNKHQSANKRFLVILSALYQANKTTFVDVLAIKGKERLYFATDQNSLEQSGSSTRPKPIPDSPYWVTTNNNTARKKVMLAKVASCLGYQASQIEKITALL